MITHQTIGRYCELAGIPERSDLVAGLDFRLPQFRREVFLRFYEFHLKYRAHPGCVYFLMPFLSELYGWGVEEKLWFAFINGNTQNPVTSWLIFKRFPSLSELNIKELKRWFDREYARLEFDTDRRHHKSHFLQSVDCYRHLCSGAQAAYFRALGVRGNTDACENFRSLWSVIMSEFHSFGRLSTFSYCEYLRIMGLNIDCDQLFLEDMSGSKSHRNGLAKVLGRDDLDWHDSNPTGFNGNYTTQLLSWLAKEAWQLREEAKGRFTGRDFYRDVGYFTLESTFCTFKSWFRPNRRYPGVYLDMLHDRIRRAEEKWPEEDFSLFWMARATLPSHLLLEKNIGDYGVRKEKQNHFRLTGQVIMMDEDWECFRNDYNAGVARRNFFQEAVRCG